MFWKDSTDFRTEELELGGDVDGVEPGGSTADGDVEDDDDVTACDSRDTGVRTGNASINDAGLTPVVECGVFR